MKLLTGSSQAVLEIARALNLPAKTTAFTLNVRADKVVTVDVEVLADESAAHVVATVLSRYKLVEDNEAPNVGGEARLAAHQPSQTTTATPQGVASTDQLGRVSEARN